MPFLPLLPPMDVASSVVVEARAETRPTFIGDNGALANARSIANQFGPEVSVPGRPDVDPRKLYDNSRVEVELAPRVRYELAANHGTDFAAALYAPRIIVPQIDDTSKAPAAMLLHTVGLGWERERGRYHLSSQLSGSYGRVSTTALLINPVWEGAGLPQAPNPILSPLEAPTFTLLFAQPVASVELRLSRHVRLTPLIQYNAFGGADAESRVAIALVHGPAARLALEVDTSKQVHLRTTVGGGRQFVVFGDQAFDARAGRTTVSNRDGAPITLGEVEERLRYTWTPRLESEVAAGVRAAGDRATGSALYPTVEALTVYRRPDRFGNMTAIAVIGRVAPWINNFSGDLEQRGELVGAASYTIGRVFLRGQAAAANVMLTPDSTSKYTILQAEGGVGYKLHRDWSVDGGLRFGVQNYANWARAAEVTQTMGYVGLSYAPLPLRL